MTDILAVPLKRGSDVDLSRPLTRWIASTFSSADQPEDVGSSVSDLNKMRQGVARLTERGEAGLLGASNYYDQLVALESKIPANELQVPFKWKDAFDRGGIFGSRISLTVPSLAYEKMCVLFNVGAFYSGVAADQNLETSDGLQKALKRLQIAAGIFHHLKDNVVGAIQQDPTPDLEPETLNVLGDIMLAQAQEMVTLKAMNDKMKDAVIAKLCSQCDEMFSNVMRAMQKETFKSLWDSEWLPNVSGKQAIYNGLAHYHQSRVCNATKAVGEEIARLEYAKKLFNAGLERGTPGLCNTKEWLKRADRELTTARKDNDFIYHERIPDEKSLAAIAKALVAKPIALGERLGNPSVSLLFDSLVPVPVHQAVAAYEVRRNEVVNSELGKLKEATTLMNELLSSMNLPAALEETKGNELPQSLVSKANNVKEAGGVESLKELIKELPELLTRNTEILGECERLLKEEKSSDDQLKEQFKDKWKRTPSDQLTTAFNSNALKYRTIVSNATQADKVVREKFDVHKDGMEALSCGGGSLKSVVPDGQSKGHGLPIAAKLLAQMEQVETTRAERQVIESELRSTKPDMKKIFLDAFHKEGSISEPTVSAESLNRVFRPLQKQVEESVKAQENLMNDIKKNHEIFVQQSGGGGANAREEKLKQLAASYDAYFEIKGNLSEGIKFYNDLTQLLVTFQNKVSDFCFARRTEKEELMKDLTSTMSNMSVSQPPNPPSHHSSSSDGARKEPPPRPPPPTVAPAVTASAPNPYAGAPVPPAIPYPSERAVYAPPPAANPANLPYPMHPNMPVPSSGNFYSPQAYPPGYTPYAQPAYPGYPQQQQQQQQQQALPAGYGYQAAPQQQQALPAGYGYQAAPQQQQQQQPYAPYPGQPQQPGQQPQWR